ncbi:MAG: hypothetical protein ACTSQB_02105 [Candidatus Heimdallarchaeota archaeon]
MKIDDHKNKKRYEISICDSCASSKSGLIQIFEMKRSKTRNQAPCDVCQAQTNIVYQGFADSEVECNHIASKLKS